MATGNIGFINADPEKTGFSQVDIIADYLAELEGESYTFLNSDNLRKLKNDGLIPENVFNLSLELSKKIKLLPTELWNVKAYKESKEWDAIHSLAQIIYSAM
ncbi:hypothetical protein [Mucilaginibacter aquariorum]|uniref:Uncharacterized protein n=1 Tax=Mucilaginibacter aquariorum TaxID=2967225 RepID=A0ABT1T8P8_9SPHI|nr:hypothetical protein [Mucilaginibacter aquariorum]MCQ6960993.1 hypothetical protein [Mucilaginibacter aquariorum]